MSIKVEQIPNIFSQSYFDLLASRKDAIQDYILRNNVLEQNLHCTLSPQQKVDMTDGLFDIIEYILKNNKLATNTILCSKYGFSKNTIARGSKLRHNDSRNGFFPLKKNSIVGSPDTPFSDSEAIYLGVGGDGTEASFKWYMRLGKFSGAPDPSVRNMIDTYGMVTCRRIKEVNSKTLNVFLNIAYQPTSLKHGHGLSHIDYILMEKIYKFLTIPLVKLYCSQGLPELPENALSSDLISAMQDKKHQLYNYTVVKVTPIGFENENIYKGTIGQNIYDTIFRAYGVPRGVGRKSIYGQDRYFVQLLTPLLNIIEFILNGQSSISPRGNMLTKEFWNMPGLNNEKAQIKILGYWAPTLYNFKGEEAVRKRQQINFNEHGFHQELVIPANLFKRENRYKYFNSKTADCNRKFYILDLLQSASVGHDSSEFKAEWIKSIKEADALLVIKQAAIQLAGKSGLYPLEPLPRHTPINGTWDYLNKFEELLNSGQTPENSDKIACAISNYPDKRICHQTIPWRGGGNSKTGSRSKSGSNRRSKPKYYDNEYHEYYELNLKDSERETWVRETFEEMPEATKKEKELMSKQYLYIFKNIFKLGKYLNDTITTTEKIITEPQSIRVGALNKKNNRKKKKKKASRTKRR